MNGKCFDIGTVQAFLDGETAQTLSLQITGHVANCRNCALLLADAEEETAVVFSALDREYNSLVPTQRLWSKINDSIEIERSHTPFWAKLRHSFAVFIANPSITVAASVLIVFSILAAIWTMRSNAPVEVSSSSGNDTASTQPQRSAIVPASTTHDNNGLPAAIDIPLQAKATNPSEKDRNAAIYTNFNVRSNSPRPQNIVYREPAAPEYLPGEESYVKTIAGLKQNVDGEKDSVLPPSSRVAYERDMAVVDNAITRMKAVVRKNPRNQSAKQVLYSSYQDKIDLLNSVAQREELMASVSLR